MPTVNLQKVFTPYRAWLTAAGNVIPVLVLCLMGDGYRVRPLPGATGYSTVETFYAPTAAITADRAISLNPDAIVAALSYASRANQAALIAELTLSESRAVAALLGLDTDGDTRTLHVRIGTHALHCL